MRLGADVDALERLGTDIDRHATRLASLRGDLSAVEAATVWSGPDANRFRHEWRGAFEPGVRSIVIALTEVAADLRRQAAHQRITSQGWDLGVLLDPTVAVASIVGGRRVSAATSIPAPPRRVRLFSVEVAGGADLVGSARAELRVEDLSDGRLRVTELNDVAVGVGASSGGGLSVSWGGSTFGATGSASATLEALVGGERSWVIAGSDLEPFLVSQVVGRPGDIVAAGASGLVGAIPFGGAIAEGLGLGRIVRDIGYDPPDPERVEVHGGASAATDASAGGSGAVSMAGVLGVDDVAAISLAPSTGAVTISLASSAVGSLDLDGLGIDRSLGGDVATKVSLTADSVGRPTELVLDLTTTDAAELVHQRVVLDLTASSVRESAAHLVDALARGNGDGPAGRQALSDVIRSAASNLESQRSTYDIGDLGSYGIELPVGSLMVTTRELTLRP